MGIVSEIIIVDRTAQNILPKPCEEWNDFWVPITSTALWVLPPMRIGQRVMIALGQLHPKMFDEITGSTADVWEVISGSDQNWELFWSKIFELFIEDL